LSLPDHQPTTLDNGYRHLALGEVGSTNAVCLEKAEAGDLGELWITAERQLQGRGSRGRHWVSEAGNLYASLLLREPGAPEKLHTLTFVASLVIRDAIYALPNAQYADITLKWPNDVLVNGSKTSGILLESHEISGVRFVVMGMGINIAHHPHGTLHSATHLSSEGIETDISALFRNLTVAMDKRLHQWNGGNEFEATRTDWLAAASGINETIEVRLPKEATPIRGVFRGIDEDGLLLLGGPGGDTRRISVADIFFA